MSDEERSITREDASCSSDESLNVSRLITEEDLIDSLFYTCDTENTSRVPVSRLVEYLKFTTSSINDSENELVHLSSLLDPDKNDSAVDIATYRDGIRKWIEDIRCRNEDWYDIDDVLLQNSMVPYRQTLSGNSSLTLSCSFIKGTSLLNSNLENSGVGDGSTRCNDLEPELVHRISDLQHTNKVLTDENTKLQQQIDILEESISSGTTEMENLRTKIKCLQCNIAWKREIQQENEDLKENVNILQERGKNLENKINILEKENNHLDKQSSEFEKKICHLMSELENSNYQCQQLMFNLSETKCLLTNAQEDKVTQDAEFCRKVAEVKELKKLTSDLIQKYEELKNQKIELQIQFNNAEQEIKNFQSKIEKCVANDTFPDDGNCYLVSSTPVKQLSICCELQEIMGFDKKLPSPLNEKEMTENVFVDTLSHLGLADLEDFLECSPVTMTMNDDLSLDVSDFVGKLKSRQEGFMSQLETFVQLVKSESTSENHPQNFQNRFKTEMTNLSEKVSSLKKAKQLSDIWLSNLVNKMKQIKEENEHLRQKNDVTKKMLSDYDSKLDDMTDSRVSMLGDQLMADSSELTALKEELEITSLSIEKMCEVEKSMKQKAETLMIANIDLTDRCHKADVKSSELQDEISKVVETLKKEREKYAELQDSSTAGKLARQLDLQEIWGLVKAELEKECNKDQIIKPSSIEFLKEQISEEIESLKTKLIKKQAALGALHSKPKLCPLPLKSHCYCGHSLDQESCKSSPLVEALTIDFLSSNNTFNRVNKYCTTSHSECSNLAEKCQYSHCNDPVHNHSNVQSCPSLDQKSHSVTTTTQTDVNNSVVISQTNLLTSSSSSTSGALDLDLWSTSSRSIEGQNKRKDFLRSCLRFESDSQTSQSIESNTADTDTSQVRQRSPSFRAAVEGHCYKTGDTSNSFYFKRNHSFSTAVEHSASPLEGDGCARSRSLSFQTAVESGQHTPTEQEVDFILTSADITPENSHLSDLYWKEVTETKNVYFDLQPSDLEKNGNNRSESANHSVLSCMLMECSRDQISNDSIKAVNTEKRSPNHVRKLPILVEEEDFNEDNIEHLSPYYRTSCHVQQSSPMNRNVILPPYPHSPRKQETENRIIKIDTSTDFAKDTIQLTQSMCASSESAELTMKSQSSPVLTEFQNTEYGIVLHNESLLKSSLLSKSFNVDTEVDAVSENIETEIVDYKQCNKDSSLPDVTANTSTSGKDVGSIPLRRGASLSMQSDKQQHCESIQPHNMEQLKKTDEEKASVSNGEILASAQPKLSKLREDNLARKREQMRHMTMPGLAELAENDTTTDKPLTQHPVQPIVITNGDVTLPPPPSDDPIFPSVPDEFLQKLGLLANITLDKVSLEQLSEDEIEQKFASLSLAFKTDKQTLEKRVDIQERARDIAEKNADKELQGIRTGLETLNHLCNDHQVQDVLQKIQHHLDIIEHTTAKISCRAEVFGAVQQEMRMSRAIDIMVHHVENLRRIHEREHSELEETRRLLQDTRPYGTSLDPSDMHLNRRSTSVCANNMTNRSSRRRVSEVALPKVLGGSGSTGHITNLSQLDASIFTECKQTGLKKDNSQSDDEDPRTRFQVAVASTSVRNIVANTFRRASLEKQSNVSSTRSFSREGSQETKNPGREKSPSKQNSQDDEAFHKGFEQGYRAHLGQQLTELRINQSHINQNLEGIMDKCDEPDEEDKTLKALLKEKIQGYFPHWEWASARKTLRATMAGCIFFMAILSIILSLFPVGSATLEVRTEYRHMGKPPL